MTDRRIALLQLICGQICVCLSLVVTPGLLLLGLFGHVSWATCGMGLLASAHFILSLLEFASNGRWTLSGWRAVTVRTLPLINILAIVWLLEHSAHAWLAAGFALLWVSVNLARKSQIRVNHNNDDSLHPSLPVDQNQAGRHASRDNDISMMDF